MTRRNSTMTVSSGYPLIEEIETGLLPPDAFGIVKDDASSFFLDSGMDANTLGRYSFVGSDPFLVLSSRGSEV